MKPNCIKWTFYYLFLNMQFMRIGHVQYVLSVLFMLQNLAGAQLLQIYRGKSSTGVVQISSNILYVITDLPRNKMLSVLSFI